MLQTISKEQPLPYQKHQPKISNLALVSLSLTSGLMGMDSENRLFGRLPSAIYLKINKSEYNRRRCKLGNHTDCIRLKLASYFKEFADYFILDSMPMEVCKLSRSSRSRICKKDSYYYPNKSYCPSQFANYYVYKVHAICSVNSIFHGIDLDPASLHDVNYLNDSDAKIGYFTQMGDRGYLSA